MREGHQVLPPGLPDGEAEIVHHAEIAGLAVESDLKRSFSTPGLGDDPSSGRGEQSSETITSSGRYRCSSADCSVAPQIVRLVVGRDDDADEVVLEGHADILGAPMLRARSG